MAEEAPEQLATELGRFFLGCDAAKSFNG